MVRRDPRRMDEDDVRNRPTRYGSRARTKQRPAHADAASAMVITVDRGRFTVLLDGSELQLTAMRARELGRKAIAVGDQVGVVGDLPDQDMSLRITMVFRLAGDRWQIVHRHADPLVRTIPFDHFAALARGLDG